MCLSLCRRGMHASVESQSIPEIQCWQWRQTSQLRRDAKRRGASADSGEDRDGKRWDQYELKCDGHLQ
jgi:hypothetical protein